MKPAANSAFPLSPEAPKAFIKRGLTSAAAAKQSGKDISSTAVLGKLAQRLDKARKASGIKP